MPTAYSKKRRQSAVPVGGVELSSRALGSELALADVPDIMTFITSPEYLNRPNIYPRQATLMKVIFLEKENLTDFDYEVINEWSEGFTLGSVGPKSGPQTMDRDGNLSDVTTVRYQGDWGIVPDVLHRMEILRLRGYKWFNLVLQVLGRRSSKGYMGGLCAAYILWNYMCNEDIRGKYGIDRDKRLAAQVYAGKKMQARDNQWRDIVNVINGSHCFQPYINSSLTDTLTIWAASDLTDGKRDDTFSTMDQAAFELVPKEATTMAGRGPASFMQFYDEMAHMVNLSGGSRSAEEVWEAATPALGQFKQDQFIYCGSSPWQMVGKFYQLCQQTLEIEADTGEPVYPENLMVQLASWDLYEDWARTLTSFKLRPPVDVPAKMTKTDYGDEYVYKKAFTRPELIAKPILTGPIQEYDPQMRRLERANRDTFRVERRSKWAAILDNYLPTEHVKRMFAPYQGVALEMQRHGNATIDYVMHGDPGKTGSNFGFCIAHKEDDPGGGLPHVILDYVHGWQADDFPNRWSLPSAAQGEMDYIAIEEEIKDWITKFLPSIVGLDQWNSIGMLQRLGNHAREVSFKSVNVRERSATAPLNWRTAETFKIALSLDRVHSPVYDLLELECTFLQKKPGDKVDHPDTGPCTTKDVYDAVSICVYELIGAEVSLAYGEAFSKLSIRGTAGGDALSGSPSSVMQPQRSNFDAARAFSQFSADRRRAQRGRPRR